MNRALLATRRLWIGICIVIVTSGGLSLTAIMSRMGFVQILWWDLSTPLLSRRGMATMLFAILGASAAVVPCRFRSQLAFASTLLFAMSGYAVGVPASSNPLTAIAELSIIHLPLVVGFMWLRSPEIGSRPDCCVKCGYPLIGMKRSRCPECGQGTA